MKPNKNSPLNITETKDIIKHLNMHRPYLSRGKFIITFSFKSRKFIMHVRVSKGETADSSLLQP